MNKKRQFVLGVVIVVAVIGMVVYFAKASPTPTTSAGLDSSTSTPVASTNQNADGTTPTTPVEKTFTLAEISQHNTKASCYTTVNGSVYDLTPFIGMHPGGEANIMRICGIDGSAAFSDQHTGQRRPANELASLKIGTLAQ